MAMTFFPVLMCIQGVWLRSFLVVGHTGVHDTMNSFRVELHVVDLGKLRERQIQKGLIIVHTGRESIKLAPPLSISKQALLEGLDVLEQSISDVIIGQSV